MVSAPPPDGRRLRLQGMLSYQQSYEVAALQPAASSWVPQLVDHWYTESGFDLGDARLAA
jgi:hypothetical protein